MTANPSPHFAVKEAVRDAIYRASLLLDEGRLAEWLELCDPDFTYRIKTYSPEIRKEMIWYEQDRSGLKSAIEMLPVHNTDHGQLARHVTVYEVSVAEGSGEAGAISSFVCYRTQLDGSNSHIDAGTSNLFVLGKYRDRLRLTAAGPRFVERTVMLDTRRLDMGSHYPV